MVGAKRSTDDKLATRFIARLAKELVINSDSGFSLARNTQALKEALRKSVDSLPHGKLRATLQLILEQERQLEAFISALQLEIRALSVKLELHEDVLLTSTVSEHLFETLLDCIDVKATSSFTNASGNHVFSHDEMQLLLARDPAPHILWALAAVKFISADGASCASASEFLHCLKPWIVDRDASVAMATMAPLAPLIFESLEQVSRDVSKLKTLQTLMKEVLSFIVAVNYKEHFTKGFAKNHSRETLSFSALLDGFQAVLKAFKLQGTDTQTETHSIATKISRMFSLAPEVAASALKPPDVRIGLLADIAKSQLLLLYMVVEVLYCRHKLKGGDTMVISDIGFLKEQVGRIAVNGLASGQSDLILDILLSDMSILNSLLDDEEKSLVSISIYKALLLYSYGFLENNVDTLPRGKKGLDGFMKRIAVARKYASKQRSKYDIMKDVACYLAVPPKLVEYLKSRKMRRSLSQKEILNNRALIGWLVQLDDSDFQALVNWTIIPDSQADEKTSRGQDDVDNSKDAVVKEKAYNEAEMEDLFFLDTTGEQQVQDTSACTRRSKKSKKRKAKQVLYHRQGRVTKVEEDQGLSEGSSEGSIDSSDSGSKSMIRGKRRNGGKSLSSSHGTEDD